MINQLQIDHNEYVSMSYLNESSFDDEFGI